MAADSESNKIIEMLSQRVEDLEKQVKKLVAGEVILYDLQARLDQQRKMQAELLQLSEKLHSSHHDEQIGRVVAEALVEAFEFQKAIVCALDPETGDLSVIGLDGYYEQEEMDLVVANAPNVIRTSHATGNYLEIHEDLWHLSLGLAQWVTLQCRSSIGELLGYLVFGNSEQGLGFHHPIDEKERSLWETIARITSTALENARLYNQLARERASLQSTRDNLRQLNEQLEYIVQERTRELLHSEARHRKLYVESERTAQIYRTLLDASPDPIVVYDIQGRATYLNPAFTKVFGWTFDDLAGKRIDFVPPENWPETNEMIQKVIGGIDFSGQETRRYTKDGSVVDVSISGAIYFDEHGRAAGSVIHLRDITERKKMEEELLKVRKLESVGVLAGGIAHDFNNILSGILMNAQMAQMALQANPRVRNYLTGIENATRRAAALTQQLLTFSKGGAPVMKTASIAELIMDSVSFSLRGSKVKSEFSLPPNLWRVDVDEGQMNQVIQNLILNAEQAMPAGGIIKVTGENILVTEETRDRNLRLKPGRHVRISVEDRGIGIPREHLPRIFDPYFTTKQRGSGLGLATTFSIIAKHRGHITVESEVGKGSAFHIYLPAARNPTVSAGPDAEKSTFRTGKGRILVMDDEEIIRHLATDLLGSLGYEVETAADGAEAVESYSGARITGRPFDAVIMDLTVPGGMGGQEAIKELLLIDPDVKAIVSSGYSNDPVMADYGSYGFMGVVCKPYRAEDLIGEVRRVLGEKD